MQVFDKKRCIIGEGPIWNEKENLLYYTNAMGMEICMLDVYTGEVKVRTVKKDVAAIAFDKNNRLIVSRPDGVFILNKDDTVEELYDSAKHTILYANDMKVGPDGRIYVGTQSGRRKGVSTKTDGKLYSIDNDGNVSVLLNNLILSNGLEWSIDEKRFYHTDSDTGIIKEYDFDKRNGEISFTDRQVKVPGVDGFTVDKNDNLLVACWGYGHVAVVDTNNMQIKDYIKMPAKICASCGFAGEKMDLLAITTASYKADLGNDENAGFTFAEKMSFEGRKPYIFNV
jgi:sugar lactone lactonase YvrE